MASSNLSLSDEKPKEVQKMPIIIDLTSDGEASDADIYKENLNESNNPKVRVKAEDRDELIAIEYVPPIDTRNDGNPNESNDVDLENSSFDYAAALNEYHKTEVDANEPEKPKQIHHREHAVVDDFDNLVDNLSSQDKNNHLTPTNHTESDENRSATSVPSRNAFDDVLDEVESKKSSDIHDEYREDDSDSMFFTSSEDDLELHQRTLQQVVPNKRKNSRREPVNSDTDTEEEEAPRRLSRTHGSQRKKRKTLAPTSKSNGRAAVLRRRANRDEGPALLNMGSLFRNDIVADARANQGQLSQPGFNTGNKKDALKQLIDNIPEEHQHLHKSTTKHLDDACKQFKWKGQGSMRADGNGLWKLKGMNTSLYHFQLLGCAWMRGRENGQHAPYGGILADSMGYGKTVSTLANMVEGCPKKNAKNKTTLIVTPPSLCDQWMSEIDKHCGQSDIGETLLFRKASNFKGLDMCEEFPQYGIVITTYNEVMSQYPRCVYPLHLENPAEKDKLWSEVWEKDRGPLFRMTFHRVVLDEAQIIKNYESRTSKACLALLSKYRWILSGTPLSNRIEELYPYFFFLSAPGAASFKQFKSNYCKRDDTCKQRLDSILRQIMIRRTGSDRIFGRPIVTLPAIDHQTITIRFNPTERVIYDTLRQRFVEKVNQWTTTGEIQQKRHNMLIMLLRLRQACAHPFLVFKCMKETFEIEDMEKIWKLARQEGISTYRSGTMSGAGSAEVIKHVQVDARNAHEEDGRQRSLENDDLHGRSSDTIQLPTDQNGPSLTFRFRNYLRKLKDDGQFAEMNARSRCHKCRKQPKMAQLTDPCCHLYCGECLRAVLADAENNESDPHCLQCGNVIRSYEGFRAELEMSSEGRTSQPTSSDDVNQSIVEWMAAAGMLYSSKLDVVVKQMEAWLRDHPKSKLIVFTQWTGIVEVLGKICSSRGWEYCKYTGQVRPEARREAIEQFQAEDLSVRIMLAGMKAGNLGLNLTAAQFVILIDPWWNEAAEDQAFSRVFRIGQKNNVQVRRYVIRNTIEDEFMLLLQEKKQVEIDRTIDGGRDQKLTVGDLIKLFSPTPRDPVTNEPIDVEGEDGADEGFINTQAPILIDDSDEENQEFVPPRPE